MSTGRLVAIVVGVIFAIGMLTVAGLAVAGFVFASKVRVSTVQDEQGREKTVKLDTPFGSLRVDQEHRIDPQSLGIPIYPGATVTRQGAGGARVSLDLDFADQSLQVAALEMETPDRVDKVAEFYQDRAADFLITRHASGKVEFLWERGRLKKVVALEERRGRTRIALARIGAPEAN